MNIKPLAVLALSAAGLGAAGLAQARDVDVQWSVTIGSPVGLYAPPVQLHRAPVTVAQPAYRPYPVYPVGQAHVVQPRHPVYRAAAWRDADRDGIPNRYDRVYNPPWDRDGDGIPNRFDRRDPRQPQHGGGYGGGPGR